MEKSLGKEKNAPQETAAVAGYVAAPGQDHPGLAPADPVGLVEADGPLCLPDPAALRRAGAPARRSSC